MKDFVKNNKINISVFVIFLIFGVFIFQENRVDKNATYCVIENNFIELDTIFYEQECETIIRFKNVGKRPLIVEGISSTCNDISARYNMKIIPSQGIDSIFLDIDTKELGTINETVLIYCNTPQSPLKVFVNATILKP